MRLFEWFFNHSDVVFSDIITAHFVSIISDHNSFVTSFATENDKHTELTMEMMSENSGFVCNKNPRENHWFFALKPPSAAPHNIIGEGNAKKMTRLSCHFTLLLFQIRVGQKPRIPYYFLANKNLWELGLGNMVISLNVSHWIDRKTARFFVSFHISRIGNHRFLPTAEKWLHFPANRLISPCNPTTSFFNLL